MLGNRPKAHHFVQRAYLQAFCDPVPIKKSGTSFLWVHAANQPVRRQAPKECAVETYFYCHKDEGGQRNFLGESFLANLESASDDVLKAAQGGALPTTLRDRWTLTGYTAMSLARTPAAKNHIDQAAIDHSVQQIRDLINDPVRHAEFCAAMEKETGERWDPEQSKRKLKAGQVRAVQTSRAWSLRQMAETILFFQELFMEMHLLLLHANDAFFLTSDCPVRVHDPATALRLPLGFQSFEMLFPLSREYCLAGVYSSGPVRIGLQSYQVHDLNRALVRQADRFVYSPFDAAYIQDELQTSQLKRRATTRDDAIRF
jgi:Protein of unknown function (DUF4238)